MMNPVPNPCDDRVLLRLPLKTGLHRDDSRGHARDGVGDRRPARSGNSGGTSGTGDCRHLGRRFGR
jgi:hypothetical protein